MTKASAPLEAAKTIKTAGENACPTEASSVFAKVGQAFSPPKGADA
jgi:hypothetical protein